MSNSSFWRGHNRNRPVGEMIRFGRKIFHLFEFGHRYKAAIVPELPAMIAATKVGDAAGFIDYEVAAMRAYIAQQMQLHILIARQHQWFVQVIFKQRERAALLVFCGQ